MKCIPRRSLSSSAATEAKYESAQTTLQLAVMQRKYQFLHHLEPMWQSIAFCSFVFFLFISLFGKALIDPMTAHAIPSV
ncbi:unnamed protein product [Cylindrotheca closterium]|uniref:Uncharacterized protein n=1 Tax=Cylindrotheca closterium TaxID=2856 RepID=A0AAD2FN65_9STRA|nr:unnamed protein product [Cylindrotheca closterium]